MPGTIPIVSPPPFFAPRHAAAITPVRPPVQTTKPRRAATSPAFKARCSTVSFQRDPSPELPTVLHTSFRDMSFHHLRCVNERHQRAFIFGNNKANCDAVLPPLIPIFSDPPSAHLSLILDVPCGFSRPIARAFCCAFRSLARIPAAVAL